MSDTAMRIGSIIGWICFTALASVCVGALAAWAVDVWRDKRDERIRRKLGLSNPYGRFGDGK